MSAAAKKRPIEVIFKSSDENRAYKIPTKDKAKVLKFLKKYEEETVPWRAAFGDLIEKHSKPGLMVRGFRKKADLTQVELAKKMGIEQNSISQMEHGKRTIGKEMAKRFAKVFKVDYRVFL